MTSFILSDVGIYLLCVVFGVGLGLVGREGSRRAAVGGWLVCAVFVVQLISHGSAPMFASPVVILALGITALLSNLERDAHSPLLTDEPWWRKVILMALHARAIRSAALLEQDEAEDTRTS